MKYTFSCHILGLRLSCFKFSSLRWFLRKFVLPKPETGSDEKSMENGYMTLLGFADVVAVNSESKLESKHQYQSGMKFLFFCDIGYKDTARMLVETALVLLKDVKKEGPEGTGGGILTLGSVLGPQLLYRLTEHKATFNMETSKERCI
ncbi:unnamed protein product [Amoebophrya sp. A25]|nr:unnamed protein product [Amoebophrya sp. A25]|eukprot:GSA25T00003921001.1